MSHAVNHRPAAIQRDVRPHPIQFRRVDKPIRVNLLGDGASARCETEQSHYLRLHICREFRERACRQVDAVERPRRCDAHAVVVPIQCHACLGEFL